MALTTAHRVQTFSKIKLDNIIIDREGVQIKIPDRIKTSGLHKTQPFLVFPNFQEMPELCVASTIIHYLRRTKEIRKPEQTYLFLTHKKPIHQATVQTLSRWVKTVLKNSGVDTTIFSTHSTRHAATSAAARLGVNIDTIRNTAGWTRSSQVFNKFYNRPLVQNTSEFAVSVLRLGTLGAK